MWGTNDYHITGCGYAAYNCTDFAQWRMKNDLHMGCTAWGNAYTWASRAAAQGKSVDGTPRVHDVFCLGPNVNGAGPLGHVGVVLGISGGNAWVEDYNWVAPLRYGQHWLRISGSHFIHLAQVAPPPPTQPGTATNFYGTARPGQGQTLHVRSGPGLHFGILPPDIPNGWQVHFDRYAYGDAVWDPVGHNWDHRWFHAVNRGWVTSALVSGNPPGSHP